MHWNAPPARARGTPLAALLLAGCIPADEDEPIDETSQEVVVCPGPNLVYGIDVSVYQGDIDWAKVATAKDFAIARVSDRSYLDTKFDKNWSGMKAAGIIRGAYQYFEPAQDATAQANIMIQKMVGFGPGDLPPMLDVEATGASRRRRSPPRSTPGSTRSRPPPGGLPHLHG